MAGVVEELSWRGLISQSTDLSELDRELGSDPVPVYAGFDPTAASLHAGSLMPLLTLRRLQLAGHKPIVLAGGATGLVGDPRPQGQRILHTPDVVAQWSTRIQHQLAKFVTFDDSPTGAVLVNNLDWTTPMTAIELLRTVGRHFPVNTMIARDTIKRRLDTDTISFTEFSYLLLQANDYLQLYRRYGCHLQVGGSDQWGNIIAGVDLARRADGATLHALTVPLVTSSDGQKLGKSTGGGSAWLDPDLTSPTAWHDYFLHTSDADVIRYLKWFTFRTCDEIAELNTLTTTEPHLQTAQHALAADLTALVHGQNSHTV